MPRNIADCTPERGNPGGRRRTGTIGGSAKYAVTLVPLLCSSAHADSEGCSGMKDRLHGDSRSPLRSNPSGINRIARKFVLLLRLILFRYLIGRLLYVGLIRMSTRPPQNPVTDPAEILFGSTVGCVDHALCTDEHPVRR